MILPAFGIISDVIAVHCHKRIFGYRFIAYSSIAIALLSFIVWGHHMFTAGMSPMTTIIFSALTFSVSVPSAIKVFNWLATMYKGSISLTTADVLHDRLLVLVHDRWLTGLHLGTLATDMHLHDTYFVVAHFHYVMVGGTLVAFLAGVFHWWPKMFGKLYNEFGGRLSSVIGVYRIQSDVPAAVCSRQSRNATALRNLRSGVCLLAPDEYLGGDATGLRVVGRLSDRCCIRLDSGKRAPANPWGGATLEWRCTSPSAVLQL